MQPPIDTSPRRRSDESTADLDSEQCPCCAATVPPGSRSHSLGWAHIGSRDSSMQPGQDLFSPLRPMPLRYPSELGDSITARDPTPSDSLVIQPSTDTDAQDSTPPPTTQESASPIAPTPPRPPSLQMEDRLSTIPSRSAVKERGTTPHTTKAPVATLTLPALPRPVLRASPPSGDRDHRTPAPFQDPLSLPLPVPPPLLMSLVDSAPMSGALDPATAMANQAPPPLGLDVPPLSLHLDSCGTSLASCPTGSAVFVPPDSGLGDVISGQVYVGSNKDVNDMRAVASIRATAFLCCARDLHPPGFVTSEDLSSGRVAYRNLHLLDATDVSLVEALPAAFAFLDAAREAKRVTIIYCQAGASRSVAIAVAYLMRESKASFTAALEHVRSTRSQADPNFAFCAQLADSAAIPDRPSRLTYFLSKQTSLADFGANSDSERSGSRGRSESPQRTRAVDEVSDDAVPADDDSDLHRLHSATTLSVAEDLMPSSTWDSRMSHVSAHHVRQRQRLWSSVGETGSAVFSGHFGLGKHVDASGSWRSPAKRSSSIPEPPLSPPPEDDISLHELQAVERALTKSISGSNFANWRVVERSTEERCADAESAESTPRAVAKGEMSISVWFRVHDLPSYLLLSRASSTAALRNVRGASLYVCPPPSDCVSGSPILTQRNTAGGTSVSGSLPLVSTVGSSGASPSLVGGTVKSPVSSPGSPPLPSNASVVCNVATSTRGAPERALPLTASCVPSLPSSVSVSLPSPGSGPAGPMLLSQKRGTDAVKPLRLVADPSVGSVSRQGSSFYPDTAPTNAPTPISTPSRPE